MLEKFLSNFVFSKLFEAPLKFSFAEMGGWKLEVGKMAMYITFPVVTFYYFNQPALFEEWVVKTKRELYPPEDPEMRRRFEESFRISRERHAAKFDNE